MARMAYVEKDQATEKIRDILSKNNWANIFRMMGHSESHLYNYCRLGNAIRFRGELSPGLREIAITWTGILCHAEYEVVAHKRLCAAAKHLTPRALVELLLAIGVYIMTSKFLNTFDVDLQSPAELIRI